MCGILVTNRDIQHVHLDVIIEYLKRRGPDATTITYKHSYHFIHTLLSMTGPVTKQPFMNAEETIICLYNGEIYNFHDFGDYASDGECIIPLYKTYGRDFINKLDGEFALVLFDFQKQHLIVSTDIFSTRPLWVSFDGDEIGISTYQSCLTRLGFENTFQMLANTTYLIDIRTLQLLDIYPVHRFDLHQFKTCFDDWKIAFQNAIRKRVAYAKCGIFMGLSAGYDSGAIACELTRQHVHFTAYSIVNVEDSNTMQQRHERLQDCILTSLHREQFLEARQFLKEHAEEYRLNIDNGDYNQYFEAFREHHYEKADKILKLAQFRKKGQVLTDDNGAIGCSYICQEAIKTGAKIYLSGSGADEIFSDYGYGGYKYFRHSTIGGYFPPDLATVFPWKNFFGNTQRAYLMKEEYVTGAYGIEGRYPFLDKYVVQEFLWLSHTLKNSAYKAPLDNYLEQHLFPYEKDQKTGFGCGFAGPSPSETTHYRELSENEKSTKKRKVCDNLHDASKVDLSNPIKSKSYEYYDSISKSSIKHYHGYCYTVTLDSGLVRHPGAMYSSSSFTSCPYMVQENDVVIGSPRDNADVICSEGQGFYCFWTSRILYFSSSDGSDPRTNDKSYSIYCGVPPTHICT